MRPRPLALLVAGLLCFGTTARAQDNIEMAKRHYLAGEQFYEHGDFDAAIREFRLSYDLSRKPTLLYNLAQAATKAGHEQEAIDYLRAYVQAAPDAPDAEATRRQIAMRQLAIDQLKAKARADAEAALRRDGGAEAPEGHHATWPGWALIGGGAAMIAGGVVCGVLAERDARAVEAPAGTPGQIVWQNPIAANETNGRTFQDVGIGLDIAGGVVAAAGIGWLVYAMHRNGELAATQQHAWIAPTAGGIVAGGSF